MKEYRRKIAEEIRRDHKERKLRNSKAAGRAKTIFNSISADDSAEKAYWRELARQKRTTRLLITFYDVNSDGRKRRRFGSDATSIVAMFEHYETLPMARQLRAAGVRPAAFPEEKSTMVVYVTEQEHVMLRMMLGGEVEMREEAAVGRGTYTPPELRLLAA